MLNINNKIKLPEHVIAYTYMYNKERKYLNTQLQQHIINTKRKYLNMLLQLLHNLKKVTIIIDIYINITIIKETIKTHNCNK